MSSLREFSTRSPKGNSAQALYETDDWTRLRRFLILGSEAAKYTVAAKDSTELTAQNAKTLMRCLENDGIRTVNEIVKVSHGGFAPKNDPALFALALASANEDVRVREAAFEALRKVARTGTHLLHFVQFMQQFRGWGAMPRREIGRWFNEKNPANLAYQVAKYQSRDNWAMRDVLRLAHPTAPSDTHNIIYQWITRGWDGVGLEPHDNEALEQIWAMERLKQAEKDGSLTPEMAAKYVLDYRLTREMVPTAMLAQPLVLEALLQDMPLTAMIRNLANLTRHGVIAPFSDGLGTVVNRLGDVEYLRRSRVHPMAILVALRTYANGQGYRSENTWAPIPQIVDALNEAFYATFQNVEPSGKRFLLALDVSGSMGSVGTVAGIDSMTAREVSAAMALITAATEPKTHIVAFTSGSSRNRWNTGIRTLDISPRMRLDDVIRKVSGLNFGYTDCSLPMSWARENKIAVDCFNIYTDNETNTGGSPMEELYTYRLAIESEAKLVTVATESSGVTIADPNDSGSLDVTGFDASVPALISAFAAGKM